MSFYVCRTTREKDASRQKLNIYLLFFLYWLFRLSVLIICPQAFGLLSMQAFTQTHRHPHTDTLSHPRTHIHKHKCTHAHTLTPAHTHTHPHTHAHKHKCMHNPNEKCNSTTFFQETKLGHRQQKLRTRKEVGKLLVLFNKNNHIFLSSKTFQS